MLFFMVENSCKLFGIPLASDFLPIPKHGYVASSDLSTRPALAFSYDLVLECSLELDGDTVRDYGYCWPEEIESVESSLYSREDRASQGVTAAPLWILPLDLTKAPALSVNQALTTLARLEGLKSL